MEFTLVINIVDCTSFRRAFILHSNDKDYLPRKTKDIEHLFHWQGYELASKTHLSLNNGLGIVSSINLPTGISESTLDLITNAFVDDNPYASVVILNECFFNEE